MKILHAKISPSYYDVFNSKTGWQDWSRVIYNKENNSCKVIQGNKLRYLDTMKVLSYITKLKKDKPE